jgi:endonuclease-3
MDKPLFFWGGFGFCPFILFPVHFIIHLWYFPMTKKEKAAYIVQELERLYPETPVPLDHQDAYTLLIAVLLSAQCTDERVNKITPLLFAKAQTPQAMVQLSIEEIKAIVRPCGLSPMKSKAIFHLSEILLREHEGKVPQSFEALEKLPGVGHKTASVVMAQAFGVPAFPVDTHIHRLLTRWGLSSGKNVKETEGAAKRLFPKDLWNKLHLQIIFYGREYSPARSPRKEVDYITLKIGTPKALKELK